MFQEIMKWLGTWIAAIFRSSQKGYIALACEDVPDNVQDGQIYLLGDKGAYWQAVMKCPCGCSETIQLPMSRGARPCWTFSGSMSKPTLRPSVHRNRGCRSHFIVSEGRIQWCRD